MRRRLFIFLSAFSVLFALFFCGMWIRSHYTADRLNRGRKEVYEFEIHSLDGRFGMGWHRVGSSTTNPMYWEYESGFLASSPWSYQTFEYEHRDDEIVETQILGVDYAYFDYGIVDKRMAGNWGWGVDIPYSELVILSVVLPSLWIFGYVRKRRKPKPGHCQKCGYNLRAHSAGQRCPECGTAIVEPKLEATPKHQRTPGSDFPSAR